MRYDLKKRIGPVPIALVAVLALAAFISAGLWLVPDNGAQAAFLSPDNSPQPQVTAVTATGSIEDVTLDVGEAGGTIDDTAASDLFNLDGATVTYTVTQSATGDDALDGIADGNFVEATGFTIPANVSDAQNDAGKSSTITITATDNSDATNTASVSFKITVEQDPIKLNGVMVMNPSTSDGTDFAAYPTSGDCEVSDPGTNLVSRGVTLGPVNVNNDGDTADDGESATLGLLISGGKCNTTGDSVDVTIRAYDPTAGTEADATVHLVYVTGGSSFKKVSPDLAKDGLNQHLLSIDQETQNVLGVQTAGEEKITVSKSMAEDGIVYLIGYPDQAAGSTTGVLYDDVEGETDSTTFAADAGYVVKVVFLEPIDAGKSTATVSSITTGDEIGATGEETVTVTVKDSNGSPVEGVGVSLDLVGADPAIKFKDTGLQRAIAASMADGTVMKEVTGLPKTGATRVTVEVNIGTEITKMVHLIRKGDPEEVSLTTYAAMPLELATGDSFFIRAKAMDSVGNDVSMETGTNLAVVGYDDDSVAAVNILAVSNIEATDDMKSGVEQWWNSLDCPQMNDAVYPMDDEPAVGADDPSSPYCKMYAGLSDEAKLVVKRAAMDWHRVMVKDGDDAPDAGMYAIKATAGEGDDKVSSDKIEFSVLGGIHAIELTGPERLGTSQIVSGFSVTATAEGGGVPGNIKRQMVTITFAPDDAATVVGTAGDNKNKIELDAMGMASFSILVTPGRLGDDNLIVIASDASGDVISDPLEVSHRQVSTGPTNSAPTTVGEVTDITMMIGDAPVTVTAGFADSDGDTLGYSASSDNTDVATAVSNGGGSVTVTAVGVGTANITVTASDGRAQATQTFMVTVSEVPDMTLGTASGLTATGGDGSVMLSWNPGNNATMYYVAGVAVMSDGSYDYSKNVWMNDDLPAADDSGMVSITISMTSDEMGLVNGTQYAFFVLSARMMDGMLEWTDWSNMARATPMAAGSGGPGSPFPTG